jgi:AcrR family transcriptional regulator
MPIKSYTEYERTFIHEASSMTLTPEETTPSRGERTHQAILDAAQQLFLSQGYNGTSMRQIAQRAGIALGGIYNHFAAKEDILTALLEMHSPYPEMLEALASLEGDSGPELLAQIFVSITTIAQNHFDFLRLGFIDVQERGGSSIIALLSDFVPRIIGFMPRIQAAGGIRTDIPATVILRSWIMMMIGYVLTNAVAFADGHARLPVFPDISNEEWLAAITDILLHGVAAQDTNS